MPSIRPKLLALFGHPTRTDECPLLGVKRTWRARAVMSANDPKRTLPLALSSASEDRCGWPLSGVLNSC